MPQLISQGKAEDVSLSANMEPSTENKRVYVLDDEDQVLEVIEMQLTAAGFDVVTFSRSSEFLQQANKLPNGVIVSDQRMPEIDGLTLQKRLQQLPNQFQIILLSGFPETRVAVEAMKQGAVTVLDKPYNREQLVRSVGDAFRALSRSECELSGLPPALAAGEAYLDRLSLRERQVIDLVYGGQTNKSIAIDLNISIKTVEKHRGKAMKKMSVSSLAELIRLIDRDRSRS